MPEHVHLVVMPENAGDVPPWLTALKSSLAREVMGRWREMNPPILERIRDSAGAPHFWQPGGGYDRCVIGHELFEKLAYCNRNPVVRGLCGESVDWPWSSARAYESQANYAGPPIEIDRLGRVDRPLT